MKDTDIALLEAVKTAVAKNGFAKLSTRSIGEVSGINDALIYHYFKDKEDLLLNAYIRESNKIIAALLGYLEEIQGIPFGRKERIRLMFHRMWKELLSNPDRLVFVDSYYHSNYFHNAKAVHFDQANQLFARVAAGFPSQKICKQTIYALMTIMYDAAKRVVDGMDEDNSEAEECLFSICYGLLESQMLAED